MEQIKVASRSILLSPVQTRTTIDIRQCHCFHSMPVIRVTQSIRLRITGIYARKQLRDVWVTRQEFRLDGEHLVSLRVVD